MPAGFPPIWWYELDKGNEAVDVAAMCVVRYERKHLVDDSDPRPLYFQYSTDGREARIAWLNTSGGSATRAACARTWTHEVIWSNAAALRRLVAKDQDAIAHDFAAMVRELLQRGALLRDDAKNAKPNIFVVLNDLRGDTSQPLPKPESLLTAPKPPPRVVLR